MSRPTHTPILQVTNLCYSYPDHKIFVDFSASFSAGITLIRGGDGRGKSTLLRLLAGALTPQAGQLCINGTDVQAQSAHDKAQVFYADPRSAAFDQFTVPEYFASQRASHAVFNDGVLADVTAGLGLHDHLHKQLFMLSTGSKRKVFCAAALASRAAVTLLDEPFAALDAASISFMLRWLESATLTGNRIWVIADYAAPHGLPVVQTIDLGD